MRVYKKIEPTEQLGGLAPLAQLFMFRKHHYSCFHIKYIHNKNILLHYALLHVGQLPRIIFFVASTIFWTSGPVVLKSE